MELYNELGMILSLYEPVLLDVNASKCGFTRCHPQKAKERTQTEKQTSESERMAMA